MGCGGGGGGTTTVQQQANPAATAAYKAVIDQAASVGSQPFQQYGGSLVAGFSPDQLQAMSTIQNTQGISQPYINQGVSLMQNAAQPIEPMGFSGMDQLASYGNAALANSPGFWGQSLNNANQVSALASGIPGQASLYANQAADYGNQAGTQAANSVAGVQGYLSPALNSANYVAAMSTGVPGQVQPYAQNVGNLANSTPYALSPYSNAASGDAWRVGAQAAALPGQVQPYAQNVGNLANYTPYALSPYSNAASGNAWQVGAQAAALPGQVQPYAQNVGNLANSTPGALSPYSNAASGNAWQVGAQAAALPGQVQPYAQNVGNLANTAPGALSPYANLASGNAWRAGAEGAALPRQVQPYANSATQNIDLPGYNTLDTYFNPYQQQVTQATQRLFNEQNAEQLNQVRGNATQRNAFGGDREAVSEALTAQQQQLAQAPVLANIQQQGFQQAQQELNTQQQIQQQRQQAERQNALGAGNLVLGAGQAGGQLGLGAGNLQLGSGNLTNTGLNTAGQLGLGAGNLTNTAANTAGQLGLGAGNLQLGSGSLTNTGINTAGQLGLGAGNLTNTAANTAGQLGLGAGNLQLGSGNLTNTGINTAGQLGLGAGNLTNTAANTSGQLGLGAGNLHLGAGSLTNTGINTAGQLGLGAGNLTNTAYNTSGQLGLGASNAATNAGNLYSTNSLGAANTSLGAGNLWNNAGQLNLAGLNAGVQANLGAGNLANQAGQLNLATGQAGYGEFNALNQAQIGAQEASGWLGQGAGYGIANLGAQAQQQALLGAQAQMGIGNQQQAMGQQLLNIPYEQFVQQQAYPFQTTGWLANVAEGIGSGLGGSASTTAPAPSALGQLAGLGVAGAGIYGLGSKQGWWGGGDTLTAGDGDFGGGHRGGRIGRVAGGSLGLPPGPHDDSLGLKGIPDVSVDFMPDPINPGHPKGPGAEVLQGQTSQTTSGGGSNIGSVIGGIGTAVKLGSAVADIAGGAEIGGALLGLLHRGGAVHRAQGGSTDQGVGGIPIHRAPSIDTSLTSVAAPALVQRGDTSNSDFRRGQQLNLLPEFNYAPNFSPDGFPAPMDIQPRGFNGGRLQLDVQKGRLVRPNPDGSPAPPPPATTPNDPNLDIISQIFGIPFGGGGDNRGGRVGRDSGGSLALVPDVSQGWINGYQLQPNRHVGPGLPNPPQIPKQEDPFKEIGSLTKSLGSILGDDKDKAADGGVVSLADWGRGYDYGGQVESAGQAVSGGVSQVQSGQLQQYLRLPMETLQQLAMRAGNSGVGQVVQRALQIKRMNPTLGMQPEGPQVAAPQAASIAAPAAMGTGGYGAPTGPISPSIAGTPMMGTAWRGGAFDRGGRIGYAEGGTPFMADDIEALNRMRGQLEGGFVPSADGEGLVRSPYEPSYAENERLPYRDPSLPAFYAERRAEAERQLGRGRDDPLQNRMFDARQRRDWARDIARGGRIGYEEGGDAEAGVQKDSNEINLHRALDDPKYRKQLIPDIQSPGSGPVPRPDPPLPGIIDTGKIKDALRGSPEEEAVGRDVPLSTVQKERFGTGWPYTGLSPGDHYKDTNPAVAPTIGDIYPDQPAPGGSPAASEEPPPTTATGIGAFRPTHPNRPAPSISAPPKRTGSRIAPAYGDSLGWGTDFNNNIGIDNIASEADMNAGRRSFKPGEYAVWGANPDAINAQVPSLKGLGDFDIQPISSGWSNAYRKGPGGKFLPPTPHDEDALHYMLQYQKGLAEKGQGGVPVLMGISESAFPGGNQKLSDIADAEGVRFAGPYTDEYLNRPGDQHPNAAGYKRYYQQNLGIPTVGGTPSIAAPGGGAPGSEESDLGDTPPGFNMRTRQDFANHVAPGHGSTNREPPNLMDVVLQGEAWRGENRWDSYNRGDAGDSKPGPDAPKPSQMTIGEVMESQRRHEAGDPNAIFAAGAPQIIPSTMRLAVKALNLDPNAKFDQQMQEHIYADYLMKGKQPAVRAYIEGKSDDVARAAQAVGEEWIAAQGYQGQVASGLTEARESYKRLVDNGYSREDAYHMAVTTTPLTGVNIAGGGGGGGGGGGRGGTGGGGGPDTVEGQGKGNLGVTPASYKPGAEAKGIASDMSKLLEQYKGLKTEKQKASWFQDPNIALIAAGLGMMASKSPNALGAIGEGGLQGVKVLQQQESARNKDEINAIKAQALDVRVQDLITRAIQAQDKLERTDYNTKERNDITRQRDQAMDAARAAETARKTAADKAAAEAKAAETARKKEADAEKARHAKVEEGRKQEQAENWAKYRQQNIDLLKTQYKSSFGPKDRNDPNSPWGTVYTPLHVPDPKNPPASIWAEGPVPEHSAKEQATVNLVNRLMADAKEAGTPITTEQALAIFRNPGDKVQKMLEIKANQLAQNAARIDVNADPTGKTKLDDRLKYWEPHYGVAVKNPTMPRPDPSPAAAGAGAAAGAAAAAAPARVAPPSGSTSVPTWAYPDRQGLIDGKPIFENKDGTGYYFSDGTRAPGQPPLK